MPKVNVYLPEDLERSVRDAGLPVSAVCQMALRAALHEMDGIHSSGDVSGRFTARLRTIVESAKSRRAAVAAADLVGELILQGDNLGARVLASLGVELPPPTRPPRTGGNTGSLDRDARRLLADAVRVSYEMQDPAVGTEHVVIAAASSPPLATMFSVLGLDDPALRRQVDRMRRAGTRDSTTLERLEAELARIARDLATLRGTHSTRTRGPGQPATE